MLTASSPSIGYNQPIASDRYLQLHPATYHLDFDLQITEHLWLLSSEGKLDIGCPEELTLNESLSLTIQREGIEFNHTSGALKVHNQVSHLLCILIVLASSHWRLSEPESQSDHTSLKNLLEALSEK